MMVNFKNENAAGAAVGGAAGGSVAAVSGDPNVLFVDSDNENDD